MAIEFRRDPDEALDSTHIPSQVQGHHQVGHKRSDTLMFSSSFVGFLWLTTVYLRLASKADDEDEIC